MKNYQLVALVALAGYAATIVGSLALAAPLSLIFVLGGSTVMLLSLLMAVRPHAA
jgi:hypothetical protein